MSQTNFDLLAESDPQLAKILQQELERQRDHLELIASENFTSAAVMAAWMAAVSSAESSPIAPWVRTSCQGSGSGLPPAVEAMTSVWPFGVIVTFGPAASATSSVRTSAG